VNSSTAIALYRMVQEALTNVGRHARATDVAIEMQTAGGELVLTVRDNGVGFPAGALQHEGRFGLLGMRERTVALGGRLEVDNPPGGGGRITIRLPLPPTPANPAAT
jgi:signal transduction histidine kinase